MQKTKVGLLFLILLPALVARADLSPVKDYSPSITRVQMLGQYYYSNSNYNSAAGNYTSLPSTNNLVNYSAIANVRTNLTHLQWSFYGDVQFSDTVTKGVLYNNSTGNFSFGRIGTDFVMLDSFMRLIPEFFLQVPFSSIDFTNSNNAAIGEGVTVASARMNAELKLDWFSLGGYAGYSYRSNGRSAQFPYSAYAQMDFGSVRLGGVLSGYTSLTNDQDTSNYSYRTTWQYNADAGSQLFGAVNPSLLQVDVFADFIPVKEMTISAGGGTSLNGSNMANGWNVVGAFTYRFGGVDKRNKESQPLQDFHEQTKDGVDQSLFENPNPPTRKAPTSSDVKSNMDKTEMKLEMKTKKGNSKSSSEDQ